jgi:hypothetical protein
MKIKFLVGYVGRETAMRTYIEGDEADISPAQALELIGLGVAEAVEDEVINVQTMSEEKPKYIVGKKKEKHGKNTQ